MRDTELALECLKLANGEGRTVDVVARAEAFYAFVTDDGPGELLEAVRDIVSRKRS